MATVAPDGTVKAVSMGVATVTCAVTIDGCTKEDTFAVKVMPDLALASLKVGGKAVKLGDAASVSYLLKPGKAPMVEAVAANPAIEVTVKQAEAVPGTAVVTLHDGQTGDNRKVMVNFGTKGASDTFRKGTLNDAWHWVREDPTAWMLSSANGLVITAGKGDIALGGNAATNILVCAPAPPAQNAGLVAYQCDDNFVKFVRTATFSFRRPGADAGPSAGQLQLMVEENGQQKSVATLPLDGIVGADNVLWLRLDKQGDTYTASYSVDGKKFEKMGTAQAVLKDVQVGVLACEGEMPMMMRGGGGGRRGGMPMPQAEPLKACFSNFKLVSRGLK